MHCLIPVGIFLVMSLLGTACFAQEQEYEAVRFKEGKKTKEENTSFVPLVDSKSWIEWNVNVESGGEYVLTFGHANSSPATLEIVLNENAVISVDFESTGTGGWDVTSTAPVPLLIGLNVIILKANDASGGPYVDKTLTVTLSSAGENDSGGGDDDGGGNDWGTTDNIVINAADSIDHAQQIQNSLNSLATNGSLLLLGDFTITRTIYLPSDFTWRLEGSLSLGNSATLDTIDWRPAAITEKPGGVSNIHMSGGLYKGNRQQNPGGVRFLNFVQVQYSSFRDMIIESASDDNFSLGRSAQYNEVHDLVSRYAGGNGLSDKGFRNKWYDSVAEYGDSDGWTPKSRQSEYHRCVARENNGPGFGLYARQDLPDTNLGATLNGNMFYGIEAYCNARSGVSFSIADNCGPGAEIMDNHVQGIFYKNGRGGVEIRNRLADGKIVNNSMDVIAVNNYGWSSTTLLAGISVSISGFAVPGGYSIVDKVTGFFLGHGNNLSNSTDVSIQEATNSALTVYQTQPPPIVVGNANWQSSIVCPAQESDEWRVKAYCQTMSQYLNACVMTWN